MPKKSARLIIIVILYFIVGLLNILINVSDIRDITFLVIGCICIVLGVGLFKLWSWARLMAIIFSLILILIYVLLLIGTIKNYWQGWGGVGLIVNLPNFILSLMSIDTLTRSKIKELFKKKEKNEKKLEDQNLF